MVAIRVIITVIIVVVAVWGLLMLLGWLGLRSERKKITNQYGLENILPGYYMFRMAESPNTFTFLDGFWGASATHLVFAHNSLPDAISRQIEINKVRSFEIFDYDVGEQMFAEDEGLDFCDNVLQTDIKTNAQITGGITGGVLGAISGGVLGSIAGGIWNAIGKLVSNQVLKMHKNEHVCKITLADGDVSFFYFKATYGNMNIVNSIARDI